MNRDHLFKPGHSPAGRPKNIGEMREAAKQATLPMLATLIEIAQDKEERASNRIVAADLVLTRAWGKADAYHDKQVSNEPITALSTDELTRILIESKEQAQLELPHEASLGQALLDVHNE